MSMVHDNIIMSYNVDFETETLTMKTLYHVEEVFEKTDVIFTGYLAHDFNYEMKSSIIFDVEEYPLNLFLEHQDKLLKEKKNYGWPILYKTQDEFVKFFQTHGYKVFDVSSSYGLCGFVFAKYMNIVVNGQSINYNR